MDLLNMTNGAQICKFDKKVKTTNFLSFIQTRILKFGDLFAGGKLGRNAEFQLSVSKITPKKTQGHVV